MEKELGRLSKQQFALDKDVSALESRLSAPGKTLTPNPKPQTLEKDVSALESRLSATGKTLNLKSEKYPQPSTLNPQP